MGGNMIEMQLLVCMLLVCMTGHHVTAETYDEKSTLRSTVLSGYNTDIRPVTDQTKVLNISITATIYKIVSVDAVRGTITVAVSFTTTWTDERITWTASNHNGATSIKIYKSNVWIPHLTHAYPTDMVVYDDTFMHVTYSNTGLATYMSGDIIETMCQFNVMYWPFDYQECVLKIFAYDQKITDVQFVSVSGDMSAMLPNTEWTVLGVDTFLSTEMDVSFANYRMKLKRQSTYYVIQIILPMLGIATLNPMVFLLPSESGERVGYSTTILLSITVFLTIVGDSIPKTSDPFPLFLILLTMGLLMGLGTTLLVLFNLHIFHKDDNKHPVSRRMRRLVAMVNSASCKKRTPRQIFPSDDVPEKNVKKMFPHDMDDEDVQEVAMSSKDDVPRKVYPKDFETRSDGADTPKDVTWADVSHAIDTICFVPLLMMHVVGCTSLTLVMAFAGN